MGFVLIGCFWGGVADLGAVAAASSLKDTVVTLAVATLVAIRTGQVAFSLWGFTANWLFAQKPLEPPNRSKTSQTPKFHENPALPRNPPKDSH